MIWRIVVRYGELAGRAPIVSQESAYATFDGLFQQALLRHTFGDADAIGRLRAQVGPVLEAMF